MYIYIYIYICISAFKKPWLLPSFKATYLGKFLN